MRSGTPTPDRILTDFDLRRLPPGFYSDPYPAYRALRETSPVHRCPDGSYFLTRHADLRRVYRDARAFSSDKRRQFRPVFGDSPLYEHHTSSLVFNDPPLHTHVRQAAGDALSPKALTAMTGDLVRLVDRQLDWLADRGCFDLMNEFASLIPIEVIGNLLRIPHADRGPLRRWSSDILGALEFDVTDAGIAAGNCSVTEFLDYLRGLVADRRRAPGDAHDDVLSRLLQWERDGARLTEHALYHQCVFLLNAGHETTTNLIGNGVHALLTHPEQLVRLRAEPRLIGGAVEEFLRYESPAQLGNRQALAAAEVGGVTVPAGANLTLCIGAANRDPAVFPDPDRLDITRDASAHLAFGGGIHTCAGLHVARLEATIAIGRLLARFPRLAFDGVPQRASRARFRGFLSLPLAGW